MAYNFHTENNKVKLVTMYINVTQEVLFGNAVFAALMSGRKYDVISQNSDCSRENNVPTLVFRKKFLSKRNVVTEVNMEMIQLQKRLRDVG
jgi:hypothetical protein